MPNIIDILARALSLRQETALNSITPNRAGGIMYDTLLVLNQMQLEGGALLISKVYASVSAMEADTTPTSDLTGRALKPGQLVVIVTSDSSSSDMGSEYRFNGPGSWTYVGKVGGLPLDTVPTQSSTKGITSGGVYTALAAMKAEGYKYMGLATPGSGGTAPGTPNQPVFYIAGPGSYPNFGSITVASGYLGFIKYSSGSWTVESVAVGKDYDEQISTLDGQISQLEAKVDEFREVVLISSFRRNTEDGVSYSDGDYVGTAKIPFHHDAHTNVNALFGDVTTFYWSGATYLGFRTSHYQETPETWKAEDHTLPVTDIAFQVYAPYYLQFTTPLYYSEEPVVGEILTLGKKDILTNGYSVGFSNRSYIRTKFGKTIPAGVVLSSVGAYTASSIYIIYADGSETNYSIEQNIPLTLPKDAVGCIPINGSSATLVFKGKIDINKDETDNDIQEIQEEINGVYDDLPIDLSYENEAYQPIILGKIIPQGTSVDYTGNLYVYDSENTEVLWLGEQSPKVAPFDIVKVIPVTNSVTIHIDGFAYTKAKSDELFARKVETCTEEEVNEMLDNRLANINYGPITINGSGVTKNASSYGFLPTATAAENATALQTCLNGGGLILIDFPGVYNIGSTLFVDSNTTIVCGAGVYLKRAVNGTTGTIPRHIFVNRGATSRIYNSNISFYGLRIIPDASISDRYQDAEIAVGLRGIVSMFYVKNLIIDGFELIDHEYNQYSLQVCTFENVQLRNIHIETLKDGIHFGRGRWFVVEHCKFLTNDDALAFNSVDYPNSNAETGWIEDGVVSDITFMPKPEGSAFEDKRGVFLLTGAWKEWQSGNTYKVYGDYCVNNGRLYQTMGTLNDDTLVSTVAPTHASGTVTYSDGLTWLMKQENGVGYTAGVRRIIFDGMYFYRKTMPVFFFSSELSTYLRSIYPGAESYKNTDISFKRIYSVGGSTAAIAVYSPIDRIRIEDSILEGLTSSIVFFSRFSAETPTDMNVNLTFIGNYYANVPLLKKTSGEWGATINVVGSMSNGHSLTFEGITPTVINNDLE